MDFLFPCLLVGVGVGANQGTLDSYGINKTPWLMHKGHFFLEF
jgi:hypothetical protein